MRRWIVFGLIALFGLGAGVALAQQPPAPPRPMPIAPGAVPPGAPAASKPAVENIEVREAPPMCPNPGLKGGAGPVSTPTQSVIFWIFAAITILGALATVTSRNLVVAVMSLVGTFMGLAALYVLLYAGFLAVIQVLVYAGAIMVLFVFVVMILNKEEEEPWALRSGKLWKGLGGLALVYLVARTIMVLGAQNARWAQGAPASLPCDFGSTMQVGNTLFSSYLFPFEAVSLVLLIAVVGALVLAHPAHPNVGEEEEVNDR